MPNNKVISVDTLQRFYNNTINAIQHKGSGAISIGDFYDFGGHISYSANSRLLTDQIFSAKQWWSMDAYPIVNYPIDGNNTACFMINSKMTVDMGGFTTSWTDNPLSLLWCFINLPDSFGTYNADIKMYFAFPKDPTQQIEVHLVITAGSLESNTAQVITVGSGGGGADLTVIADEFDTTPILVPNEYFNGDKVVYEDTPYQSTRDNNANTPDSGTGWTTLTFTTMNSGGMVNTVGQIIKSGTTGKFYECTKAYSWFDPASPNSGVFSQIADYDATAESYHQYSVGDYCIYENKLYKCTTNTEGSMWDSYCWEETQIMDEIGSGSSGGGSTPEYVILGDWDSVQNAYTAASNSSIQDAITAGASRFAITFNSSMVLIPTAIGVADDNTSMPIIKTLEQIVAGINQSQYNGVILNMRLQFTNTTSSEDARYNVSFVMNGGSHAILQNQGQKLVM